MRESFSPSDPSPQQYRVYGSKKNASFQVIVLGANGGPREDTVTGLLVRAPHSAWRKSSVIAVDAGAHLASIIAILQRYMPHSSATLPDPGYSKLLKEGPFAGIKFPHISAKANALYIFRDLLHSFLITHPHLDHIAALGINTPALEYGREAKAIIALPSVIEAIKAHIFNDAIWPNLSDEAHGVGFVTYRRLTEGGNQRLGSGEARGYVSVCDGLATKCLAVTHGKCLRHAHGPSHQRGESSGWFSSDYNFPSRRMSRMSDDYGYFTSMSQQQMYSNTANQLPPGPLTPGLLPGSALVADKDPFHEPVTSSAFFIRNEISGREILIFGDIEPDTVSMSPRNYLVWEEAAPKIVSGSLGAIFIECSYDDSVRDADLFGHLCPRHLITELDSLARKVMAYKEKPASGARSGKADSPKSSRLTLSEPPTQADLMRKRKRGVNGDGPVAVEADENPRPRGMEAPGTVPYVGSRTGSSSSRRLSRDASHPNMPSPLQRPMTPSRMSRHVQFQGSPKALRRLSQSQTEAGNTEVDNHTAFYPPLEAQSGARIEPPMVEVPPKERLPAPLHGLTVHIIHVKDTMQDGPGPGDAIRDQLHTLAADINLGCEFDVTESGESIWI